MYLIKAENCKDAWMEASNYLLTKSGCEESNLIIDIANADIYDESWLKDYNSKRLVLKDKLISD